jgi:hypothetical protein
MLLPDGKRALYVPWAYSGLDKTSQHRLRLPEDLVTSMDSLLDGERSILSGDRLRPLEPFFSGREFSLIERVELQPFVCEEEIVAILVVLVSRNRGGEPRDLRALQPAAPLAAEKVRASRALLFREQEAANSDGARERLDRILVDAKREGSYLLLARINIDAIADALLVDPTTADVFRFRSDVKAALGRMVSASGELVEINAGLAVLVVRSRAPYSERLLVHQIEAGIRGLVSKAPALGRIAERTWKYPDESFTVDEVLNAEAG